MASQVLIRAHGFLSIHPVARRGFLLQRGMLLASCPQPMTLDTQMALALLQELLMAVKLFRPNYERKYLAILPSV